MSLQNKPYSQQVDYNVTVEVTYQATFTISCPSNDIKELERRAMALARDEGVSAATIMIDSPKIVSIERT